MLNLIKMELYRLFHSTSTWILFFFTIVAVVFTVVMTKADVSGMEPGTRKETEKTEEQEPDFAFGIFSETKEEWADGEVRFSELLGSELASGIFLILVTIFVSFFVHAEQKNGYLKNIAGQLSGRWLLALSKLVAVLVWGACMFSLLAVTMAAAGRVCFGKAFVLDSAGKLFTVLGGQYLLHMAFAALLLFLCTLSGSAALSITAGLLIACKVTALLYSLADRMMKSVFGIKTFDSGRYAIEMNITKYMYATEWKEIVPMLLSAGVILAVTVCLTAVVLQKRDVK